MSRRLVALAGALGLAILLLPSPAAASPVTVKVMTLNIFYGGDERNLDTGKWCVDPAGCPETMQHVVSTIRAADPDIVGLQEATTERVRAGRHARLVQDVAAEGRDLRDPALDG